jgi:hypothetical protein
MASPLLALLKASNYLIMRFFATLRMTLFGLLEVFPDQPVLSSARAGEALIQTTAALAYPPYLPGRDTGHQGIIFHIFGHDSSGSDHGTASNRMTAHDRAIRAERCAFAHARTRVNSVHREVRPRSIYIRENTGRATEDIVFDFNPFVDRNIVLNPDAIPNAGVVSNVHILAQRTIRSDDSSLLDMAEMPNSRSGADMDAVIDVTALVNEIVLHCPTLL